MMERPQTYIAHSQLPLTLKSHQPHPSRPLHPERDVDSAMQLVHLARYPWKSTGEVDLIAQNLSSLWIGPQRVQCAAHHRTRLLLVVENGEGGSDHNHGEDGDGAQPSIR